MWAEESHVEVRDHSPGSPAFGNVLVRIPLRARLPRREALHTTKSIVEEMDAMNILRPAARTIVASFFLGNRVAQQCHLGRMNLLPSAFDRVRPKRHVLQRVFLSSCAFLGLTAPGCGESTSSDGATDESSGSSSSSTGPSATSTADPSTTGVGETSATTAATETTETLGDAESDGGDFVMDPDVGSMACNVLSPDCPEGQKCYPLLQTASGEAVEDGSGTCIDLPNSPKQRGQSCQLMVAPDYLLDECDEGLICGLDGACGDRCSGTAERPTCTDTTKECVVEAPLWSCATPCDLLEQDCEPGLACLVFGQDSAVCSGVPEDPAAAGEPCTFSNACEPGLQCFPGVAGCESEQCCTPFCDVGGPNDCPGAEAGEVCRPLSVEGVGACGLPGAAPQSPVFAATTME